MKKHRLMVIDDRLSDRKNEYDRVLSEDFELIFIEKASTLYDKIVQETVDAYLVDIVLTNWKNLENKRLELKEVLSWIGTEKPVVLLSNEYTFLIKEGELTQLFNTILDEGYKVNPFFVWEDFVRVSKNGPEDLNPISNTIKLTIARHVKMQLKKAAQKFDLGVIAALGEELKPFLEHLTETKKEEFHKIKYTSGILETQSGRRLKVIAIQQEEMGTVDTAILSASIVKEFDLNWLIMIGVCGGRDGKVAIGDIIIPNEVVAYQKGKITDTGLTMDIDISKSNVNAKMTFENNCAHIVTDLFKAYMNKLIEEGTMLAVQKPELKFDEMACGENVVNKEGELEAIAQKVNKPKLCAIDMETYAIFRVNTFYNVSTLIIKAVMDLSSNKSDKYKSYAAFLSANFLHRVLKEEILEIQPR